MTTEPKSSVLFEVLQRGTLTDCYKQQHLFRDYPSNSPISKSVKALLQLTEFRLIHAVRLMIVMSCLSEGEYKVDFNKYLFKDEGHELLLFYHRHHPESNLRALANVFELLKLPKDQIRIEVSGRFHASTEEGWRCFLESLNLAPERIGTEMLHDQQNRGFWRWDSEAIWPYFAEHVHRIKDSIAIKIDTNWWQRYESRGLRKNGIRVLKTFPQPPAQLVSTLWDLALEGSKDERVIAQKCLNTLEGTQARLLTTLFDPNRDMRIVAADWLGDSADKTVIAPLKQALKQEKSEAAKDIMLRSLERLGASMDEFLGREHLLKECQQLLRKGIPRTISWFPFADIPPVYWSDTVEAVDSDILKGLILKCFNQKKPEPGPILRRYVAMWQPDGREALGQFVLENWIAQDHGPMYTPQEADQQAQHSAKQRLQYIQQLQKQNPNAISAPYQATYDEIYQEHYQYLMRQCRGSATKEKGILAIAAACCGKDAVPPIKTYLKTWYGQRAVQCKMLLQLLTWIDDNSATQLLISVSDRFRTRGIQKEAEKLVNELAKRNGWSSDELSDRTIPTAGFDQGVEQTLNYGSRQFTLLLDANMSLVLKNPDGKVIKSLPTARKDDDADLVKAAKKQLSDSRKQLKQVLTMQQARLYEAMCTQRAWRFPDWDLYLNQHPIVGRYCQQLVWAIYDGDTLVQTLRPLEDRTFTNAEDEEVTPPPEAIIRLAHSCIIPSELTTAWQTHFADYGVMPLFQQFRASAYVLPEARRRDTRLIDFEGYLIQAFQLRGLASKRDYTRGHAQDGGWFYDYRKAFSSLGIEAVIEFSGNSLPGEDRTVALTYLSFCRLPEETDAGYFYNHAQLPLEEVPPVLLSETWNDLQAISAQGRGYDPDWQKKVEY